MAFWSSVSWAQLVGGILLGTGSVILVDLIGLPKVTGPPIVDLEVSVLDVKPTETGVLLAVKSSFTKRRICPAYITWFAEREELFQLDGFDGVPFRFPLTVPYPATAEVGFDTRLTVLWLNLPPGAYRAFPAGQYACDDGIYPLVGVDSGPVEPIRFSIVEQDGKLVCVLPES